MQESGFPSIAARYGQSVFLSSQAPHSVRTDTFMGTPMRSRQLRIKHIFPWRGLRPRSS